jgi:hypothetical protein
MTITDEESSACCALQDSHIGTAVLDLGQLDPAAMSYLELPLSFEKPKHAAAGGQARLVLSVKGWISSFGTLLADTKHIPGVPAWSISPSPQVMDLQCRSGREPFEGSTAVLFQTASGWQASI